MSGFDFRLQPLLDHKRQQEEQKTLELARLADEERRAREALDAMRREEQAHLRALESLARQGAIDPGRYQATTMYLEYLHRAIDRQTGLLDGVMADVDGRRLELQHLLKEKRSLERLRERRAEEAALDEARREARRVDEQTTARHVRRAAGAEGGL